MTSKPATGGGYGSEQLDHVRRICLYMATKLATCSVKLWWSAGWFPISLLTKKTCRQARNLMRERWTWTWIRVGHFERRALSKVEREAA